MTWRVGISTGACVDQSILESLPQIRDGGAHGVEIGTPPRHFNPDQPGEVAAVRQALLALGIEAVSIHAPFGVGCDLADADPTRRERAVASVLGAAAAIKAFGGRLIVVHPSDLERHAHDAAARLADAAQSLGELARRCREESLTLAIESPLPHLIGGDPDEFRWLLTHLDESARVCLDTGHTSLGGHWRRFVSVADGRLAHVHASDNHGHRDDHLPPGDGQLDWTDIKRTLEAADFRGWIMLELHGAAGVINSAFFKRALERATTLLV